MLEENKSFSSSIQNNVPGVDNNLHMQSQNSAWLPLIIVSILTITFMLFILKFDRSILITLKIKNIPCIKSAFDF